MFKTKLIILLLKQVVSTVFIVSSLPSLKHGAILNFPLSFATLY